MAGAIKEDHKRDEGKKRERERETLEKPRLRRAMHLMATSLTN